MKTKDVRPSVVTDDIEVILASGNLTEVDLGGENRILIEDGSREHLPWRIDDGAPPRMITVSGSSPWTAA